LRHISFPPYNNISQNRYDLLCHGNLLSLLQKERVDAMEPIVLLGLIVVVYGGLVALQDLWQDLSGCFPRQFTRVFRSCSHRGGDVKSPIKKMAGMHV
jgi:hypothetical protein